MLDLLKTFANYARHPLQLWDELRELREEITECYDPNKIVPLTMLGLALDPVEQPQGIIDRIVRKRMQNTVSDISDGIEDGKIEIFKIHARYLSQERHEEIIKSAEEAVKHPASPEPVRSLAELFRRQVAGKETEIPCMYIGDAMNALQKARPSDIDLIALSRKAVVLDLDGRRTLQFWWRVNGMESWSNMFDKPEKPKFPPLPKNPQNTHRERVHKGANVWKPASNAA
jgi:hypothetical protein